MNWHWQIEIFESNIKSWALSKLSALRWVNKWLCHAWTWCHAGRQPAGVPENPPPHNPSSSGPEYKPSSHCLRPSGPRLSVGPAEPSEEEEKECDWLLFSPQCTHVCVFGNLVRALPWHLIRMNRGLEKPTLKALLTEMKHWRRIQLHRW